MKSKNSQTLFIFAYVLYWVSLLSMWSLREKEKELTIALSFILVLLYLIHRDANAIWTSLFIAFMSYLVSYISVKEFKIWNHNHTSYTIPVWFPLMVAIISLLVIQVYTTLK